MKKNLSNQAYEAIKLAIITCELMPGQQIAQHQLVEKYDIGTTPIREALMRLAQEGLVKPVPRFGYIVSHITLSDIHEIYEIRSILESAAARLAATRATEEQLSKIAEIARFTYIYRDRESYLSYLNKNRDFHLLIAAASGNKRLVRQISKVLDELTRVFHLGLDLRDHTERMLDEHSKLLNALYERDPEKAEKIVNAQIQGSLDWILQSITTHGNGNDLERTLAGSVQMHP